MSQSRTESATAEPTTDAETRRERSTGGAFVGRPAWQRGVLGGIVGGLIAAAVLSVWLPEHLETTIPGLYGLEGGVVGWVMMVSHAAVLGVVYAAVASIDGVREFAEPVSTGTVMGIVFGALAALLVGDALVPAWADAMNVADAPAVLSFEPVIYGAYVAFGLVLGAVYAVLSPRIDR